MPKSGSHRMLSRASATYECIHLCVYMPLCIYGTLALCISYVTFRRSKRSTFWRSKRSTFRRSKRTPDLRLCTLSVFTHILLTHGRRKQPDLGGIDTHRHCFAAWYVTLQNHNFRTPKTPPVYDVFCNLRQLPPPTSLRSRITTSQLPSWLS
jgi:hypothetical protein